MNLSKPVRGSIATLALAAGSLLPPAALAQSAPAPWSADQWKYNAILYVYLPTIGGSLSFPVTSGGDSVSVNADTLLDSLNFAFMGTFDAHNGRWGVFTDVLYLSISGSTSETRDFSIGNVGLPASVSLNGDLDLKGVIWTLAGEYRLASSKEWTVDALAGARYFGIKPTLNWNFNGTIAGTPVAAQRQGSSSIREYNWDGIVGLKGTYAFGRDGEWKVPLYVDVGTGQSDLTWQAAAGIGYGFKWGDVLAMWRYIDYHFKSGDAINDMTFNGPMLGVRFGW